MSEKRECKVCENCKRLIFLKKDHYVCVSTFNRATLPDAHVYFHFSCWVEYFNERVSRKATAGVQNIQAQAVKIFDSPMFRGLLGGVKGSEQAMNMLKMPLNETFDDDRNKRDEKSKAGKKKMPKL
jgi:hypothetical protein